MINNFGTIEKNLLQFQEGSYYKFEALVRNTDGHNDLYYEGMSNTNKNILIKTWWVDTEEYYQRMKKEMKTLCDMTGARLYVLLDRKSCKRTLSSMSQISTQLIMDYYVHGNSHPPLTAVQKIAGRASSIGESSDRGMRMWMFDIDSDDFTLLKNIQDLCYPRNFFTLRTKKGYHVCVSKKDFPRPDTEVGAPLITNYPYLWEHKNKWTVHGNAMGLVYIPDS